MIDYIFWLVFGLFVLGCLFAMIFAYKGWEFQREEMQREVRYTTKGK